MGRKFLGATILFFLLYISFIIDGARADEMQCATPSSTYTNNCYGFESECSAACAKEGFEEGKCQGFLLECICYKNCN
ncbi:hypothetical protein ABFS83_06G155800 [Erythranthe nasuta]